MKSNFNQMQPTTDKEGLPISEIHHWMQSMLVNSVPVSPSGLMTDDMVCASQRLTASQHLSIYRQSYIARLRSCMQSQFKALAFALGEELFQAFADQYLDSNPSESYTLNNLGKKFPEFLSQTRPDVESDEKESWPDFMIELAAFEFTLSVIFDMQNNDGANLPDDDTPDHLLKASPVLHLFEHQFPICRYYLDFNANQSPELPFPKKTFCVVSRQNYRLGLFNIGFDQYRFLSYIIDGASIGEAKEKLVSDFNIESSQLEKVWPIWRKNFMASGFFILNQD
jgi:putative DNA-binding protein